MSDPHFERAHSRHPEDRLLARPVIDGNPGGDTAWVLVALAVMVVMAVAWFGVAPPRGDQETSATRNPIAIDIDTTGRAMPRN